MSESRIEECTSHHELARSRKTSHVKCSCLDHPPTQKDERMLQSANEKASPVGDDTDDSTNNDQTVDGNLYTGRALLFFVAFLYGTLDVALRFIYQLPGPPSPSALSSARGWLTALCFLPLVALNRNRIEAPSGESPEQQVLLRGGGAGEKQNYGSQVDEENLLEQQQQQSSPAAAPEINKEPSSLWLVSAELAFWNFGAQGLLNLGLVTVPSARASFLTQTSVVLTPVVSALVGHRVASTVWAACCLALVGLVLLSSTEDGGGFASSVGSSLSSGDLLVLLGALSWSLYIFRLSSVGKYYDDVDLQARKNILMAVLYTAWFVTTAVVCNGNNFAALWPGWNNWLTWAWMLYTAAGPGTIADVLQQKGQAVIAASESNVILSMEPVFTAILARLVLGEATSVLEKLGGGLILVAALIATR